MPGHVGEGVWPMYTVMEHTLSSSLNRWLYQHAPGLVVSGSASTGFLGFL